MKIAVAMSGGVDSSVAAYILKQKGHDIIGVTMRHFDNEKLHFAPNEGINQSIIDAKAVCEKLEIPHYEIDVRDEFEKIVMNDFISEYQKGRTPNPCTLCNRTIKWGAFAEKVFSKFNLEKIATGHYVTIKYIDNQPHIYLANDLSKDQTYMLWRLTKEQLSHTLFPLSDYEKSKIRKIAQKIGLDVANKKDSQEVCFIKGHYSTFFKEHFKIKSGDIKFKTGEKIGKHQGAVFYTIGQRKGLNMPWKSALYVYKIDVQNNIVFVTDNQNDLFSDSFVITQANWLYYPSEIDSLTVKIRYNSPPFKVKELKQIDKERYEVILIKPARAITPGQSAVFYIYKEKELLGGGVIG